MKQEDKLLQALKQRPMTKLEMLRDLGILHGGEIVRRLREHGYSIATEMIEVVTRDGSSKVARYTLSGVKK